MRERKRHDLGQDVHLDPDDTFSTSIHDGPKVKHRTSEKVGRKLVVNTIVTFDVDEPVLGLEDGIGAIFGKAAS
jgi:hypothetical protein